MELSSKVCDLCQVCNWARTVTPSILTHLLFTCPCFFSLFFFVPNPVMAPKCHRSLVELEDEIEGSGVRPRLMTPPSDPHRSQLLLLDLGLGPPSEEPSPKPPTPPEWSKKLKRGKQSKRPKWPRRPSPPPKLMMMDSAMCQHCVDTLGEDHGHVCHTKPGQAVCNYCRVQKKTCLLVSCPATSILSALWLMVFGALGATQGGQGGAPPHERCSQVVGPHQ